MKSAPKKRSRQARRPDRQRAGRHSFDEAVSRARLRVRSHSNQRIPKRQMRSVHAAIAMEDDGVGKFPTAWLRRPLRWMLGLLLLPLCWVTTWTFLSRFSQATLERGFWSTAEFWYFAVGALSMIGWFWSGLARSFFLYLYVLGHELTHVVFVWFCRGRVTDIHVSAKGGYITTNKTNLLIALSPYFVPFWSVACAILYVIVKLAIRPGPSWDLGFYTLMGVTWTFHMVWTLWMIPRDQPDLRQNGTFLSMVIIYLANVIVLAALFCAASDSPLAGGIEFAREWLRHAATWGDAAWRASLDISGQAVEHWLR
ncbi:MAG: hypothetical protein ACO3RV_06025 [Luteolibacter sp.]